MPALAGVDSPMMPKSGGCRILIVLTALLASCAGQRATDDPITIAFDPAVPTRDRVSAIRAISADSANGELPADLVRERLKDLAWAYGERAAVRRAAVEALLNDKTPQGQDDARQTLLAMLPTEPNWEIADMIIGASSERKWEGARVALVRSLSRPRRGVALEDRAESSALHALQAGRTLPELVFDVFARTTLDGLGPRDALIARRTRQDAWNLVNLLVPGREDVARMVGNWQGQEDSWIAALRRGERELGVMPMTGRELAWLVELSSDEHRAWWDSVRKVVAGLDERDRTDLALRHLEVLRWVSEYRPAWLVAPRTTLHAEVSGRLGGRHFHKRTVDQTRLRRG